MSGPAPASVDNGRRTRSGSRRTVTPSSPARAARARVPELPPLELSDSGHLGFPGIPPSSHAHNTSPRDQLFRPLDPPRDLTGTQGALPQWNVPLFEDGRRPVDELAPEPRNEPSPRVPPPGIIGKIMVFLGYAGPDAAARRATAGLVIGLLWWISQFVVIIVLLVISTIKESPTIHGMSEWSACDRPLGAWNALWLIKVMLEVLMAVWVWRRNRPAPGGTNQRSTIHDGPTQPRTNGQTPNITRRSQTQRSRSDRERRQRPQSPTLARVSLLTSFWTLAWFLAAHVFEYTSVHTCRVASPHIWWLTLAILCTQYLIIAEVFLLGLLVFILGPVLYLMYNILLLCLGRHPLQNPHFIKPDINKLPKSIVEQIPLVLYIPPPPEETTDVTTPSIVVPKEAHSYPPKSPTTTPPRSSVPKRRFAFLRRKKTKKSPGTDAAADKNKDVEASAGMDEDEDEDVPWDEMWEKGEYPFVRLEGNRAVCAICLMDFEEPKRVRGKKNIAGAKPKDTDNVPSVDADKDNAPSADADADSGLSSPMPGAFTVTPEEKGADGVEDQQADASGSGATQEIQVEAVTEEERDALKLSDAGEGAQPLRLLTCGHVFHKTCLDPWLIDVSGRCPICQRPVEIPQPTKKSKRGRRRT